LKLAKDSQRTLSSSFECSISKDPIFTSNSMLSGFLDKLLEVIGLSVMLRLKAGAFSTAVRWRNCLIETLLWESTGVASHLD